MFCFFLPLTAICQTNGLAGTATSPDAKPPEQLRPFSLGQQEIQPINSRARRGPWAAGCRGPEQRCPPGLWEDKLGGPRPPCPLARPSWPRAGLGSVFLVPASSKPSSVALRKSRMFSHKSQLYLPHSYPTPRGSHVAGLRQGTGCAGRKAVPPRSRQHEVTSDQRGHLEARGRHKRSSLVLPAASPLQP